jgi:hypothetical protein
MRGRHDDAAWCQAVATAQGTGVQCQRHAGALVVARKVSEKQQRRRCAVKVKMNAVRHAAAVVDILNQNRRKE